MSRSTGTVAPPPEFTFVRCDICAKKRRIGRAVSLCNSCDEAMCEQHLDKCTCLEERRQLALAGVA